MNPKGKIILKIADIIKMDKPFDSALYSVSKK